MYVYVVILCWFRRVEPKFMTRNKFANTVVSFTDWLWNADTIKFTFNRYSNETVQDGQTIQVPMQHHLNAWVQGYVVSHHTA